MLKLKGKSIAGLMLFSTVLGFGFFTGNASAMSARTKKILTTLQAKETKTTKSSKKINSELGKVGVKNLNALMQNSSNNKIPNTLNPELRTYELLRNTKVSVGGKSSIVLPKGSVVQGHEYTLNPKFPSRFAINVESLSKKNQRSVFTTLGKTQQTVFFTLNSANKDNIKIYTKNTVFSYDGIQNLPNLSYKNLQSYYDSDRSNNPFITVTADGYLNYYTNYKNGNKIDFSKYSQSIKIKKFIRGNKTYTYYLAKPLLGFNTKRVRVGKSYQYKLLVSLGHVFRSYDNYNLDPGGYRMTVNVGSKNFYIDLGNIVDTYIGNAKNDQYVANDVKPIDAQQYVDNLR